MCVAWHQEQEIEDAMASASSRGYLLEVQESLRVNPYDAGDLQALAASFQGSIDKLPTGSTICSISILTAGEMCVGQSERKTSSSSLKAQSWLLVSRIVAGHHPLTFLMPAAPVTEPLEDALWVQAGDATNHKTDVFSPYDMDSDDTSVAHSEAQDRVCSASSGSHSGMKDAMLEVAAILEESRQSTSGAFLTESKEQKARWWEWRIHLDHRLRLLLSVMQESWLGPWKCLLLGSLNISDVQAKCLKKAACEIASLLEGSQGCPLAGIKGCLSEVVHVILQGMSSFSDDELQAICGQLLKLEEGSGTSSPSAAAAVAVGRRVEQRVRQGRRKGTGSSTAPQKSLTSLLDVATLAQAFQEAHTRMVVMCAGTERLGEGLRMQQQKKVALCIKNGTRRTRNNTQTQVEEALSSKQSPCDEEGTPLGRRCVQLVLASEVQGFPWESLPILRKEAVYRMPSLGSIHALATMHYHQHHHDNAHGAARMATVDPHQLFFLLNPSTDLKSTQALFQPWFESQQDWHGKVGVPPTPDECARALREHDVFVYLGHGSGEQYVSKQRVQSLSRCAASLLMGCSSGKLWPRGDYEPVGIPLSYLAASSPVVAANLWDVTDGDIDRFSVSLLELFLKRPGPDGVLGSKTRSHEKYEKSQGELQSGSGTESKACMSTAVTSSRDVCKLPYLIGASPVCYGIPTGIVERVSP